MRIIFAILLCGIPAFGAARTSTQAGAWSDSATWGGSAPPGNGDTATVCHVVHVDTSVTVGDSPNQMYATTPAIHVQTNGSTCLGEVEIRSGGTLTVRGDVKMTSVASSTSRISTFEVQRGGTWQFDSSQASNPGVIVYRLYNAVSNSYVNLFMGQDGGSGTATFTSMTTNGAAYGVMYDQTTGRPNIKIAHADISKCGTQFQYNSSSTPAITDVSVTSNVATVTFDGPHGLYNSGNRFWFRQNSTGPHFSSNDFTVASVPTANSLTFAVTAANATGLLNANTYLTVSNACIEFELSNNNNAFEGFVMSDTVMDDTNGVGVGRAINTSGTGADIISITRTKIVNRIADVDGARIRGSLMVIVNGSAITTNGTTGIIGVREIVDSYIESPSTATQSYYGGFTISGSVFTGNIDTNVSAGASVPTANVMGGFSNNVHLKNVAVETSKLSGDWTDNFFIQTKDLNSSGSNPHGWSNESRADAVISGNLFEFAYTSTGPSEANLVNQMYCNTDCSAYTHTYKNNIVLPASYYTYEQDLDPEVDAVLGSSIFMNQIGTTTNFPVLKLEHNTAGPLFGVCCTGSPYFGEGGNAVTGSIDYFQSNLQWQTTAAAGTSYAWTTDSSYRATLAVDPVTPANTTHNACGNCKTVPAMTWTVSGKDQSNGTVYDIPTSAVPGANDLATSEMPGFVDAKRSFRSCADHALGLPFGSSTLDSTIEYLTDDLSTQAQKIADCVAYVKAGFAPTNEAYRGAGHDGEDIGAIPMAAEASTSAYKPMSKKSIAPAAPKKQYVLAWVDNTNSAASTDAWIGRAVAAGLNGIIITVQPNRYLNYRQCTQGEPLYSELSGATDIYPGGFDALDYVIRQGRAAGLEVHLWQAANFMAYEADDIHVPTHVWTLHGLSATGDDSWLTKRSDGFFPGDRNLLLDPGNPAAMRWTVNQIVGPLGCYQPDGIQVDYIRYPYVSSGKWFGYNQTSIDRFNRILGKSGWPVETDSDWQDWRREQVYHEMRQVFYRAKELRPNVKVSFSPVVWGNYPGSAPVGEDFSTTEPYRNGFVDWHAMIQDEIVDFAAPFIYRHENDAGEVATFNSWVAWMGQHQHTRMIAVGLGYYLGGNTDANNQAQAKRALAAGNKGFAAFDLNCFSMGESLCGALNAQSFISHKSQFPEKPAIPDFPWMTSPFKGWLMGDVSVGSGASYLNDRLTVTIKESATGDTVKTLLTDGSGFWGATLYPGFYKIEISGAGISTYTSGPLEIRAGAPTRQDASVAP